MMQVIAAIYLRQQEGTVQKLEVAAESILRAG
jgi:hypothetical protein